jgi:hypothetical protein
MRDPEAMEKAKERPPWLRLRSIVASGIKKGLSTSWFLLKIMIPVSLGVYLLEWGGILQIIAKILSPLMHLIGLPGDSAFVLISGGLLNNYSAIAVLGTISVSLRDATIISVMCLISHNLPIETTVMKNAGSSAIKMLFLRMGFALIAAFLLNLVLPASMGKSPFYSAPTPIAHEALMAGLGKWAISTLHVVLRLIIYVFIIMFTQSAFEEFKIMDFLSKALSPFMKLFGLPPEASFLWIVINVVGYAYGAGIIKTEYDSGRMKKQDADLFNHHAAITHSLFEDTMIYSAIGISVFWLIVPRLILAIAVVWLERFRRHFFRRSFKVGTL